MSYAKRDVGDKIPERESLMDSRATSTVRGATQIPTTTHFVEKLARLQISLDTSRSLCIGSLTSFDGWKLENSRLLYIDKPCSSFPECASFIVVH